MVEDKEAEELSKVYEFLDTHFAEYLDDYWVAADKAVRIYEIIKEKVHK